MFNPEKGLNESKNNEELENQIEEEGFIFESDKEMVSWSGEARVFTTVKKSNEGKYEVVFDCDDEDKLPGNNWLDLAPTTRLFDNYEEAVEYAQRAFDDRENWQNSPEYN